MSRTLRLVHRWLAPIFIVLMITVISTQGSSIGFVFQRIQQGMVLIFALTGIYLFALPWWVKWRRGWQKAAPRQGTAAERERA